MTGTFENTELPAGFHHPHASEQARVIAEQGMILRVQVGVLAPRELQQDVDDLLR
jgi:hypothetical protein